MKKNYHLAKWLNNEMTNSELADFKKNPDFETYQKIKVYSAQLEVGELNQKSILENIVKQEKNKPKKYSFSKKWMQRVAAILILSLAITYLYQNLGTQTQLAQRAEKASFLLPDDSEVVLNADSKIDFKKWNWSTNRKLNLEGEAYFKVAKGRRFEVQTNLGKVTVLGTQFDVKARNNRLDVSCYEGRVRVNYNAIALVLTQGQMVILENNKQTNLTHQDLKPAWTSNQMAFVNQDFEAVLSEIQRQYPVEISLKTIAPKALFTGKLPTNDLDIALKIMATTYDLKVKKINSNQIIFEAK